MTSTTPFNLSPLLDRLRPLLAAEALPVYAVGGTVRDALLGRASHDIDLAVAAGAISLAFRLADALSLPAYVLDAERDVGRIIVPAEGTTLDVARFRGPTLADDLLGRDFTINALALPAAGRTADDVIDHHGGRDDLATGLVRIIHSRSIADDPVRALRAARFAVQFGYTLTPDTAAAARAAGPAIPAQSSAERVRDELSRLLAGDAPDRAIALLAELELLSVVLPLVAALDGVTQSAPHHEDVLAHTLSVLRYLVLIEQVVDGQPVAEEWAADVAQALAPYRPDLREHLDRATDGGSLGRLLLRWGGLLHDVGKRVTRSVDADGRVRFLGHDDAGASIAAGILSGYSFSNESVRRVRAIVAGHMRPLFLANERHLPSRRSAYRYYRSLHEAGLDVALLSLADHLATYNGRGDAAAWSALIDVVTALLDVYFNQFERIVAPPRLIDGRAVMELLANPPGPEIGRLLKLLEEAQATGEVTTADEAIAFVRRHHIAP